MKQNSIKSQRVLFGAIAIVSSIIVLGGGYLLYKTEKDKVRNQKQLEFEAIAKLKSNQIEYWRSERRLDAELFTNSITYPYIQAILSKRDTNNIAHKLINHTLDSKQYRNLLFISHKGEFLYNHFGNYHNLSEIAIENALRTIDLQRVSIGRFYFNQIDNKIYYDLFAPIYHNSNPKAVAIIRVDPNEYLFPLISDWPGSSQSAETFIVRQDQDSVLFLNSTNGYSNTQLNRWIQKFKNKSVGDSLQYGKLFEAKDFRGNNTLTYIHKIPQSPWFLITKINVNEIYAEIQTRTFYIISSALLIFLIVGQALGWIYGTRQKRIQIKLLQKEAELLKTQDEYRTTLYSIGDGVITTNENGIVTTINPIAEQLLGINEEKAKGREFASLFKLIDEYTGESLENPVSRAIATNEITSLSENAILVNTTGQEIPIHDSAAPIHNSLGEIIGVVVVFSDQTAERIQQKTLKQSEQRFSRLFENAPLAYQSLNEKGEIVEVNKAWLETFGYGSSEVVGKSFRNLLTENEADAFDTRFAEFVKQGDVYAEMRLKHKDGSELLVAISGRIGHHSNGTFDKTHCIVQDITQHRRMEEQLRESEERYRLMMENSLDAILITSPDGRIHSANKAACQMFGRTEEEICAVGRSGLVDTTDPRLSELLKKREKQGFINDELTFIRKDGSKFPGEVTSSVFQNSKGEQRTSIIARDISNRKAMEKSIRESEEKFRGLFHNHSAVKIIIDPQTGRILDANRAAETFYGWSHEQLTSMTVYDINTLPRNEIDKQMELALSNNDLHFNFTHHKADGSNIYVEVYSSKVDIGETTYLYSIIHDISQKVEFENALRQSEQRLKLILDTTAEGIYVLNNQGICTSVNKAALEVLGYESEDDLLGKNLHSITHHTYPDGSPYPENDCKVHKTLQTGERKYSEKEVFWRKNGESFKVEYWSYPIVENDEVVGSVVSFFDISERKRVEEEIIILAHAIKSTNDCVSVTDLNNNLLFVNDAFLKTYGYSKEQIIGKNIEILSSKRNSDDIHKQIAKKTLTTGWRGELWNIRSDGTELLMNLSTSSIKDEKGDVIALVGVASDITKRREIEEQQKAVYNLLKIAGKTAKFGGWYVDLVNERCVWSDEVAAIHEEQPGFSPSLKEAIDYYLPGHKERLTTLFYNCSNLGIAFDDEFQIRTAKGKIIWVRSLGQALRNEHGKITRVYGSFQDVTTIKESELRVEQSRKAMDRLIGNLSGIAYRSKFDRNWDMEFISQGCEMMTGYTDNEFYSNTISWGDIIVDEDKEYVFREIERRVKQNSYFQIEYRITNKSGDMLWVWEKGCGVFNEKGDIIALEGFITDMTERKKAEAALLESEAYQKALIDSSPIAIYGLDLDGNIISWNSAAEHIFGWTVNEVMGKPNPIVQEGKQEEFRKNLKDIIGGKGFRGRELVRQKKGGDQIVISLSTAPIYDNNNQVKGIMAVAEDITVRKKTEESLRESEEKLSGILDNITDVVWSLTWPDMKPLYLSPSVEDLYGRTVQEFLQNPSLFIETVHPDDKHLTDKAFMQLQEFGESVRECRIIRPDGNIAWIYDKSKLVYDENNRPVRVEGIAHDITKRKQAEDELIAFKNDLEVKVQEKTKELNERIEELERFYNATIDRELRMKELREEIKRLKGEQ
jgi:PAS domain S-box-containing protein